MNSYKIEARNAFLVNAAKEMLRRDVLVHRLHRNRKDYLRIGRAVFEIKDSITGPVAMLCVYRKYDIHIACLTEDFEAFIYHKSAFVPFRLDRLKD